MTEYLSNPIILIFACLIACIIGGLMGQFLAWMIVVPIFEAITSGLGWLVHKIMLAIERRRS